MLKRFILLLVLWPIIGYSAHITDKLLANMYATPSNLEQPIQQLPSGMPVELVDEKDGFVKIRLVNGKTGWVEKRVLSEDKPVKVKLLTLQGKYRELQKKQDSIEKKLADVEALALKEKAENLGELNAAREKFRIGLEKALQKRLVLREELAQKKQERKLPEQIGIEESLVVREALPARVWSISFMVLLFGVMVGIFLGVFIQARKHLRRYGEIKRNKK